MKGIGTRYCRERKASWREREGSRLNHGEAGWPEVSLGEVKENT